MIFKKIILLDKKIILLDKKIKYKDKYYSFSRKIVKKIIQIVEKYNEKGLEVGGYIFANEKLENSFHGVWTSKPHKRDIFNSHSYYLDILNEQRNININTKRKLVYSCVWHSHREQDTKPSKIDDQNIIDLLKDLRKKHILSIIFSTKETRFIFYALKSKSLTKISKIVKRKEKIWKKNTTNFW